MSIDPVCGMTVQPATAAGSYEYRGTTYYFCNPSCLTRFKADPESFLKPKDGDAAACGLRTRSTRARCTRKSCSTGRAPAPSAGWPSSR